MASGRRGAKALADAHSLVTKVGLKKLSDAGTAEIQAVCKGMSADAVNRLLAGVEIGLRIAELKSEYEKARGSAAQRALSNTVCNASDASLGNGSRRSSGS